MKKLNKQQRHLTGFTIVELLVVVVIIAILAAITVVAYSSMQTRAKNSAAQTALATFSKKIQVYYHLKGSYPSSATAVVSDLGTYKESKLPTSGLAVGAPSPTNGTNTIKIELCPNGGIKLTPWDFSTNLISTTVTNIGDTGGGACTQATA